MAPNLPPPSPASGESALFDVLGVQGGITFLGFIAGTAGVVTEGRSLSQFVSCVALPCLLLKSMATVDLGQTDIRYTFTPCHARRTSDSSHTTHFGCVLAALSQQRR
jgi:hypothetical protein